MKILTRYLLREHLVPFLYALTALTGFMLINQVARQFGSLVGKGLPWSMIAEVFGLSVPFIVAMTLPMAVLVATLHAFARLGADSEITALKASGVNLVRIVRPVLAAAVLLALATFLFIDQVLPRANHSLKTLIVDIARKKPTFELKEQMVNEVIPGQFFLRAGRIYQASDRLKNVVIYDLIGQDRRRTIYADSGFMRFNRDRTDLHLTLFDGYVHDYDRAQSGVFRRVFFHTDLVRVHGVSNRLERTANDQYKGDREMTICEMEEVVAGDARTLDAMRWERAVTIENDTRALLGAPPLPIPSGASSPRAGWAVTSAYCGTLDRIARWLSPAAAQAQRAPATPTPFTDSVMRMAPGFRPAPPPQAAPDPSGSRLKAQLAGIEARRRNTLQHVSSYRVEINKKLSIAASCIVFVLIGAPIALRFPRGGIGLVVGASVFIFGFYYVGLIGGEALAEQLVVTPFWGMWTPNLVMTAIGLVLFVLLGRQHTAKRSGRWAERWESWRERWQRRRRLA